ITSRAGRAAYRQLAGETALTARKRIAGMLGVAGDLLTGPDPVRHSVNFYEKGTQPLEIVTTRQWYGRNGAYDEDLRAALLARAGARGGRCGRGGSRWTGTRRSCGSATRTG